MDKLQQLLKKKYPTDIHIPEGVRSMNKHNQFVFTEGYQEGAADQVFELRDLLQVAFTRGAEYGQDRSRDNFTEWFSKLTK
jgi:hypothetical protein